MGEGCCCSTCELQFGGARRFSLMQGLLSLCYVEVAIKAAGRVHGGQFSSSGHAALDTKTGFLTGSPESLSEPEFTDPEARSM